LSGTGVLRWRVAGLAAAIALVIASGSWYSLSRASAQAAVRSTDAGEAQAGTPHARPTPTANPITVVSVSPSANASGVEGTTTISVQFSQPLAADSPMPTVTPSVAGSWQRTGPSTVEFVPSVGFTQQTQVRVAIPAGSSGVRSVSGGLLPAQVTSSFTTGSYGLMRAEELLAQLGYLPLTWSPSAGTAAVSADDASGQLNAAYNPPSGSFTWQPGYPSQLENLWAPGQTNTIVTGAVMAFESDHSLSMDGVIGPQVWAALLSAVAAGQDNTHGYTYALASQVTPETLTVWHNGQVIMTSPANTGIAAAPTTVGTFPVYLRYQNQIMKGTNPDGTPYADPVSWVSYFRSGEAVHYFPRASYGFPQSLGCVELPYSQAEFVWPYMTYGTLVTITAS
jgi:peptidoglycan hydrolase-like protein with peptidoglycan-binding domain